MTEEFCHYCGAGKGLFRREGEGTCHKCDPLPTMDKLLEIVKNQTFCDNCRPVGACHSPEICRRE